MPLILPSAITQRATWNGTSQHPQNALQTVKNLDSSMDWSEHQKIVTSALALLTGAAVPEAFQYLKSAYEDKAVDGRKTQIFVSKGIHQPETNPHMQLETETKSTDPLAVGAAYVKRYHLNVSAVPTPHMANRFKWFGVQFTTTDDQNSMHEYPVGIVPVMKLPATTLGRRHSVSRADLSAHIKAIAAEAAAVKSFDELCTAFEKTNCIKPIDRSIRTAKAGWVKPTYTGVANVGGKSLKFQYDSLRSTLTVVVG